MDELGEAMCSPSLSCALLFFFFFVFLIVFPSRALSLKPSCFSHSLLCLPFSLGLSPIDVAFMICFYDLSVFLSLSANLLVCCRDGIADWLWFILTPASVLWRAQSWHAYTHTLWHTRTHIQSSLFPSRVYSTGWYAAPDTREEPGRAPNIQCCDVIRHGGYRQCLFTHQCVGLCCATQSWWFSMNFRVTLACKDTERIVRMLCVWGNVWHMCFMAHACPLRDYAASCVWAISVYVSVWLKMSVYVETCGAQQQRREEWYTVISCFTHQGAVTKVFFVFCLWNITNWVI